MNLVFNFTSCTLVFTFTLSSFLPPPNFEFPRDGIIYLQFISFLPPPNYACPMSLVLTCASSPLSRRPSLSLLVSFSFSSSFSRPSNFMAFIFLPSYFSPSFLPFLHLLILPVAIGVSYCVLLSTQRISRCHQLRHLGLRVLFLSQIPSPLPLRLRWSKSGAFVLSSGIFCSLPSLMFPVSFSSLVTAYSLLLFVQTDFVII